MISRPPPIAASSLMLVKMPWQYDALDAVLGLEQLEDVREESVLKAVVGSAARGGARDDDHGLVGTLDAEPRRAHPGPA